MPSGKRLIGFFLLISGWLIGVADVMLMRPGASMAAFIVVGLAVQALGLVLVARDHIPPKGESA